MALDVEPEETNHEVSEGLAGAGIARFFALDFQHAHRQRAKRVLQGRFILDIVDRKIVQVDAADCLQIRRLFGFSYPI